MFIQIGSQTWASLSFVPPGWGANSSQSCRSCSFSGHKQRCWTVLSELRYKVPYNPNTFFLNWKQRSAEKAVEDALQYNKMYVARVWTTTAKRYFKNVEEQVIRRQSTVYSASKAACKRTQHCWPTTPNIVGCYMLRPFAHPVACCWMLLRVVAQSLKPVKRLAPCKRTQHCWPTTSNIAGSCCARLHVA